MAYVCVARSERLTVAARMDKRIVPPLLWAVYRKKRLDLEIIHGCDALLISQDGNLVALYKVGLWKMKSLQLIVGLFWVTESLWTCHFGVLPALVLQPH